MEQNFDVALEESVQAVEDKVGDTTDTGGSTTEGSVLAKLNKIISDIASFVANWTATRAGHIDTINSNTATNNTASKTGVLSAKLAYVISLLENATYGLSALKNACGSSGTVKSVQRGTGTGTITINNVNPDKCLVLLNGSGYYKRDRTDSEFQYTYAVLPYVVSLTATSLTISLSTEMGYGKGDNISWQVIEFY